MTTASPTSRPPRADGVRNRRLLLSAAADAFAEHGTDVSIAEIAQRAGIGKGTVFRHFTTKEDLLAAIMGEMVDGLVAVGVGLSDAEDPAQALLAFMTAGVELLAKDRAFCEVVGRPSLHHPDVRAGLERLCDVAERLTDRARRQKAIRPDVTGTDIVLLLGGVHQTAAPLLGAEPQLWRRYLGLVFDGIRSDRAQPLPHPAPRELRFTETTPDPSE
ncbi:TetR/AcrR family transcriptional regulator [Actinopolymorpha pittospori]|uniref:AcrR family transcriptional regulator n=1 Tax=Actinopolymorpha pittospori TaxID=648752 RepID=A0A927N4A7_9ACTN|nr:TetR/AcrR family transcriptional regulator [Actinopolymorpha pittospori]MBE1611467.1 AcrR family transcriptional regulator [Actinopolymorpha pittospori]